MGRVLGGLPEPVVGWQVAVGRIQLRQARGQQGEVQRLLVGHPDPVVGEGAGQSRPGEARDQVPGQVHGVELNVGQRVEQGDPAGAAAGAALRHVAGPAQHRALRPGGAPRHRERVAERQPARAPGSRDVPGMADLCFGLGAAQHGQSGLDESRVGHEAFGHLASALT